MQVRELDREVYVTVKSQIENIGGKWKGGKTNGFVFELPNETVEDLFSRLLTGEAVNRNKELQYYPTPHHLCNVMVDLADIESDDRILEPSAGRGAIIGAIHDRHSEISVDCYEIDEFNRSFLEKRSGNINILGKDFIAEAGDKEIYDVIIANPPFAKKQDIIHVKKMYGLLKRGGRMVVIMAAGWTFASDRLSSEFREFLETDPQTYVQTDIDSGQFKSSGTMVRTVMLTIFK